MEDSGAPQVRARREQYTIDARHRWRQQQGGHLPAACEGLIIRARSGFFDVETDDGELIRCRLRGRLLEEASATDVAAIGDRVRIEPVDEAEGVILAVAERRSTLARAARTEGKRGAGEATREQVIVANADQALFVFAAASPEPSLRLLDRFLVAGESAGIETICIVVNKLDLVTPEQVQERFQEYERMGYPVLATSALGGAGVEALRKTLEGRLSVFTGPSGVGKTSLLNVIQPGLGRMVKAVSRRREEGIHTTRDSELVRLGPGTWLADTPGIRSLNLWDIEPEELDAWFVDIAQLVADCRFGNCAHRDEPGCAVRKAVAAGRLGEGRWRSFRQLYDELEAQYAL